MSIIERKRALKRCIYKRHYSMYDVDCFYCGHLGATADHCPPVTLYENYPDYEKLIVRACSMCNSILSNYPLPTLLKRVQFLYFRYPKKYRTALSLPKWAQVDINECTGLLKRRILLAVKKQQLIQSKIIYLEKNL